MFDTIRGLPLHPLAVHAVVVLLPLAALLTALVAVRPSLRRFTPHLIALDAAVMVMTFVAKESGEALSARITQLSTPSGLGDHARWGERLFFLSVALLVGAVLVHVLRDRAGPARAVAVLLVAVSLVVVVLTVVVGESGAGMVWRDLVANTTAG